MVQGIKALKENRMKKSSMWPLLPGKNTGFIKAKPLFCYFFTPPSLIQIKQYFTLTLLL